MQTRPNVVNKGNDILKEVEVLTIFPEDLQCLEISRHYGSFISATVKSPNMAIYIIDNMLPKQNARIRLRMKYKNLEYFDMSQQVSSIKLTVFGPRRLPHIMCSSQGVSINYRIKIDNNQNETAKNLRVIAFLPENFQYISANPEGILTIKEYKPKLIVTYREAKCKNTFVPQKGKKLSKIIWEIGDILTNSSKEITVNLQGIKAGKSIILVMLEITTESFLYTSTDVVLPLGYPIAQLSTYETDDPVKVGQETTYVIQTRNEGTTPCSNVILETIVDKNMQFIKADGPSDYTIDRNIVIFKPYPILESGRKLTYQILCKAVSSGNSKNIAILNFDQFDEDIIDEEITLVNEP